VAPPGAFAFNRSRLALFSPSFFVKICKQGHTKSCQPAKGQGQQRRHPLAIAVRSEGGSG
jgi:hypothetical protein